MKDNQKKNKSLKALLYLTGLPAAALAIVVPLLHSKADIKQNSQDSISTNKLYEALLISENELKNNKRLTPEQRAELESTIKHARQIYDEIIDAHNYDSRSKVSTAIELKNKLYLQIAQFELINAQSDDEFINVANQHDKDFVLEDVKNEYKDLLNKYIDSHTGNGAKKIDKSQFIKSVSDLFEKQNKILFNLELNTDMFIYNKIVTKDFLHIDSKAASMHQIVEFINDQIKSQGISRDAVEVYEELFELKSADLYNDESKNNAINVEKIYSQIQDAKQQVSSLSIEGVEKAKLINELDSLEAFVRKSKGSLDFKVIDQNNKEVSGFKIIEEFINSFWDKTAQYFQDDQKRIEYLKSLIAQAQALIETLPQSLKAQLQSQIEQAQKFIDSKEQKNIFTKVSDFTKEFNSIKIANNVLTSVLNKIAKSNLHADSKNQFSQQLNQIKYTNFFDYVAQINSIEAQINAQSAIKEFFKNKFDELNSQINFSIKYADLLGTSSQDIESLRELQKTITTLNIEEKTRSDLATLFHRSISIVRNINKKELKNVWEKVEIEFKDKSANEILKLKNKFDTFNNKFKQYYSSFSTATRSELSATDKLNNNLNEQFIGGAVAQSLNLWYQAQLANNYTDINEKTLHLQALFDTTFDDDKFKDQENNNDNISSIQLLKKQIEEIRTKGALISNADNLEFSEKLEKLKELSRLQREYEDKLNQIKELDLQRVDADYVFNGYNDNDVAKIYFNKEIRNINRLREEARAALSDPINGNFNLRAIRDELKNALDDFREKLDNKDGESIVALIKSYINNNFANRRKDPSRPTDVEDKLLKAIDKYKGELDNNTRSIKSSTEKSQESQRIQNKMNIVRDAVPAATKFEISLEELIKEHNDSLKSVSNFRDQLNGSSGATQLHFSPENRTKFDAEINKVSARNTEIQTEIEKLQRLIRDELFDSSKHNKSFIQQKEQQIQFLRQELVILNTNLALQKEFLLMANNDITNAVLKNSHNITESPYDLLSADFALINNIKEKVFKEIEEEHIINGQKLKSLNDQLKEEKDTITSTNQTIESLWKQRLTLLDKTSLQQNARNISSQEKILITHMDKVRTIHNTIRRKMQTVISVFRDHQNLFAKIREVAIKLSEVDKNTNPELYKNISEVLKANRYSGNDNAAEINAKIENLNKIINNIESSKQAKEALNKLIELKQKQFKEDNDDHSQRTIFVEVDKQIQDIIDENTKILNNENSTEADLKRAKIALESAFERYSNEKQTIANKFKEVKENFEKEINKLLETQRTRGFSTFKQNDPANGSHLQQLKAKYDALVSKVKNGTNGSPFDKLTVEEIDELQKVLTLTHNKDAFNDKRDKLLEKHKQVSAKVPSDSSFNIQGTDGKTPFEKIKTLIDSISQDVNSKSKASENSDVIRQSDKLEAIDSLLSKQDEIIEKAKKPDLNPDVKKVLVDILKESSPVQDNVTPNSVNPSQSDIQNVVDSVSEKFNNSLSFDEVKESSKKSTQAIKDQFDNSFTNEGNDVDAKAKESIDELINKYANDIEQIRPIDTNDSNAAKAKVTDVQRKVQNIKNNINNIITYAKEIKKASDASTNAITEGPIKSVLESLKKELDDQISASQASYTDFAKFEEHKEKLSQIVARIDEIKLLNVSMTTLTNDLKTLEYKAGTATTNESATKKAQFDDFDKKLIEFAGQAAVNGDIIQIKLLSKVVSLGVDLINKHKEILKGHDLGEFMFAGNKYGYELDQKILAEATLSTVPDIPDSFNGNDLSSKLSDLIEKATMLARDASTLHSARKEAFESIKSKYDDQTNKLETKQKTKQIYTELINDKEIYFKERIDTVSKFDSTNDVDKINEIKNTDINVVSSLFDVYVQLAEKIDEAKNVKAETEKRQNKTQNLTNTLNSIQTTIESIEKTAATKTSDNFFYNEKNKITIEAKIKELSTSIAKVELFVQHAEKTNKLNTSTTITGESRKILQKVLDKLANEINGLGQASETKIENIKNTYIEGGKTSFESLYASSERLIEVIKLAEKFVPKESDKDYVDKESDQIKGFYKELEEKTDKAKDLLNNETNADKPDLQTQRELVLQEINNTTTGLIVKLKSTTANEVITLQSEIDSIDTFIKENFNEDKKPTKDEFSHLKLRDLHDLDFADINAIKEAHEKVVEAKKQIEAQKQAVVEFSKRRLKVMKQRLEGLVKLAKGDSVNVNNQTIKLTPEQAKKLQTFSGIDESRLNTYNKNLESVDTLVKKQFDKNNYIDDSRALRNKYNQLHTQYAEFKDIAKTNIILLNNQVSDFVAQLQNNTNGSTLNLFSYIDAIDKKNHNNASSLSANLQSKVTEINDNKNKIGTDVSNKLDKKELTNADYTMDTDDATQTSIYNELNDFANTSNSVLDTLISIDKLIYGSTDTDKENLQETMQKFIDNRTIENMLKLIASTQFQNTNPSNTVFQTIINSYNVIYNSLKSSSWVNSKDILTNKDAQLELKLKALQNVYRPAYELLKWMQDKGNQAFLFNYLTDNNEANAREIKPKAATLYEDVLDEITKLETQQSASGKIELDITSANELLNKFNVFNILQNEETKKPYDTTKVRVYITRTNASLPWFPQFLQADTSIKKSKINLKFVYQKPSTGPDFFNDVDNFEVEVKNVWMTFNTLSVLHISKDDLYKDGNNTEQNKTLWNDKVIFDASKGGWNAKTFNANLAEIYSRASKFAADNNSLPFFFEQVSFGEQNNDEELYQKALKGEMEVGFNGFKHRNNWAKLVDDVNANPNKDYSASPSYLKFKIRLRDTITLDRKTYTQATFKDKKFSFWLQKDIEVQAENDKVKTWIPFHIAIPLVTNDNNKTPALLFAYYRNYIETDLNGKPTFKNSYQNETEAKWYLLTPNNNLLNKARGYNAYKTKLNSEEQKQSITYFLLDDLFLAHNSKDNNLAKDSNLSKTKELDLTSSEIFKAFDKFDIYIKLRESEKK